MLGVYLILLEITDFGFQISHNQRAAGSGVGGNGIGWKFVVFEKIMDERRMKKSKGESNNRMGSWSFLLFFWSVGVGLAVCSRLMVILNMWCCTCVSYVRWWTNQIFYFKALDDLWWWWAWWDVLVGSFSEWSDDVQNKWWSRTS